ncbi:MAG: bifunctional diaminohydroxyphosphoribosylaminopyrimidine deaminase/5-amino-6-(5-phosphoribosylamino)uracil reductase RibD [Rubricoccaceae bacterium]|nr:bifunctional diaminohydroxyphosphoribosylaminopyrimidine deaminase/5-amino-6-(5-phosphoribosylamino)uracil reductase RibD [Rubricoccaceae bacterium]
MQRCLELAVRGAGFVSPNPLVGCVIVDDEGELLGEGFHRMFGGPHAEVEDIQDAESRGRAGRLKNSTLYVNLEPCSHHGKTPPCADLIIEKGIPHVVVAMEDPNPNVSGSGIVRLRNAGVEVRVGVLQKDARRLNEAFIHHIATGRPLVTLKIARTLDGKVADETGAPLSISCRASQAQVHQWRSEMDAVMVGSGTALMDNPQLTVRHVQGRQPYRIVLDRTGLLPETLQLFTDSHASKTIAVTAPNTIPSYATSLEAKDGHILNAPLQNDHLDLKAVFELIGSGDHLEKPIQSILVEAGPRLATALLEQDLVDRLFVFTAPRLLGRGTPAFNAWSPENPISFTDVQWENVGDDILFKGYLRNV